MRRGVDHTLGIPMGLITTGTIRWIFPGRSRGEISTVGMGGCRYNVNGGMN